MGTWIVGGIVLAVAGLAVYSVYKDKKNGKTCGSCEGCKAQKPLVCQMNGVLTEGKNEGAETAYHSRYRR